MKKVFFRCNSSCFTHLLLLSTGKTNMQNSKWGSLQDLVAGRPGDQMMGRSVDVPGRRPYMFFKFNSETY